MAKNTVSNHKRTIATKGSRHKATTVRPKDRCKPPRGRCQSFKNYIYTSGLSEGQTVKTFIAGHPIWTKAGVCGPPGGGPLSERRHPPHIIGCRSKVPYRQEAKPRKVSKDLIIEGHGVVRTDDPTWQNHKNTRGVVKSTRKRRADRTEEDFLKGKCTVVKLEGEEEAIRDDAKTLAKKEAAEKAYKEADLEASLAELDATAAQLRADEVRASELKEWRKKHRKFEAYGKRHAIGHKRSEREKAKAKFGVSYAHYKVSKRRIDQLQEQANAIKKDAGTARGHAIKMRAKARKAAKKHTPKIRKLGHPRKGQRGPGYYLEILTGRTVTFTAIRHDLSQKKPVIDPKCPKFVKKSKSNHTAWTAVRTGGLSLRKETTGSGKTFEVGPDTTEFWSLTGSKKLFDDTTKKAIASSKQVNSDVTKRLEDKLKEKTKAIEDRFPKWSLSKKSENKSATDDGDSVGSKTVTKETALNLTVGLDQVSALVRLWGFQADPAVVDVHAIGCAGSKKAQLKVFPADKLNFTLSLAHQRNQEAKNVREPELISKFRQNLAKVEEALDLVNKYAGYASTKVASSFMVGAQASFEFEYLELQEEKNGFITTKVNPSWLVKFGADPLLKIEAEKTISLLALAAPLLGDGVAKILRKFDVKADVTLKVGFSMGMSFSLGKDEFLDPRGFESEAYLLGEIHLGLTVSAKVQLIALSCDIETKMSLSAKVPATKKKRKSDDTLVEGELAGHAIAKFNIVAFKGEDGWILKEKTFPYKPEWAQKKWKTGPFDMMTVS